MQGTIVKVVNASHVFITPDGSAYDVFGHRSQFVDQGISFDDLAGRRCEFDVIKSPKGMTADNVRLLDGDKGREHGVIDNVKEEFAFIRADGQVGERIFVHRSEFLGNWPPAPGTRVAFTIGLDKLLRKRAFAVRREVP